MKESSYVIAVLGGKGGVGKSLLATNLAIAFARQSKVKTLLLDADPSGSGDLDIINGVTSKNYLEGVLEKVGEEKISKSQFATAVSPTAHDIDLATFFNPIRIDHPIRPHSIGPMLDVASQTYTYIIADLGVGPESLVVPFLEEATLILTVVEPDVLVLNQSRKCLGRLQRLLFPSEMIYVLLNKHNPKGPIQPAVIQKHLNKKVSLIIPNEPGAAALSLAKAQPLVVHQPNTQIAKGCVQLARSVVEQKILHRLKQITAKKPKAPMPKAGEQGEAPVAKGEKISFDEKSTKVRNDLKLHVHKSLLETLDLKDVASSKDMTPQQKMALREKAKRAILTILEREDHPFKTREEMQAIVKEVLDEALALGPLEDLLADDRVTEIMVNHAHQIYLEKDGKIQLSKTLFSSNHQLLQVIERIVAAVGRRIDEKTPYVDARLKDGSRVHAIIPPCVMQGPMLTIRKFPKERLAASDLVSFGSMTPEMAAFLEALVKAHCNIVISGGTGSGKTTLLNVISSFIPSSERIITVEDSAELNLPQDHVGRLETRPPNVEGEGEVSIRDLVKNCLRMRPDRIVVGECRGGEALDMLQAMNTGHDGSLTTVHSNSPRDCIARLQTLCLFAGMELPAKAIKEQIASAVHYVVQQARLSDGSRKVTYITEVSGIQGDVVTTQDIFEFRKLGLDEDRKVKGYFTATGYVPQITQQLDELGIEYDRELFKPEEEKPGFEDRMAKFKKTA